VAGLLGGITGFFDKYILGYALGTAAGPSLEPFVQDLANEAWTLNQVLPLDPEVAASVAAERVDAIDRMRGEAAQHGINADRFNDLYGEALNAPGLGELYSLWRRGLITDAQFTHGLDKAKLEDLWKGPLEGARDVLLSSEELAMLQQQGFIDPARANSEGALQGVTEERQQLRFDAAGLPPGHAEAQQMLNRGLIDQATFAVMIREGHTKTKYTAVLQENARRWLTAIEWVDAHLRGHATEAEMYAGTAANGITKADTDVLFASHGRGLSVHQIQTGLARGGVFEGPTDQIPAPFIASLKQGSIQPPYYNLAYANRYTIPSFFVIRALIQDGTLTEAQGAELFKQSGWPPDLADAAAAAYSGGTVAKADTHVAKAQTQLWTATHRSYIADETDDATATTALTAAGVAAASIPAVLTTWKAERDLIRKQLTPTQLRKAYQNAVVNPATGQPWTKDDVIQQLLDRGYTLSDATTFVNT
jgi:hypothetical protein